MEYVHSKRPTLLLLILCLVALSLFLVGTEALLNRTPAYGPVTNSARGRPSSLPVDPQILAASIAPPTVSFTEDRTSMNVGQPVTLTITAASVGGTVTSIDVFWGDGHHDPFTTPTFPLIDSHSYSTSGTFRVEVSATNNAGLVSSSSSTKTVTDIPPTVSFTMDKTSVSTNSPVTITISSSDADGTVTSVDVFWGDGNHNAFPSPLPSITASHSYTTVGTPSIEVDATDNAQLVSTASRALTVTDIPPQVSFTADKTTTATGSPVTLTIASSDVDGTISSVDVFWGDGSHDAFPTPLASITASHSYTSASSPSIEVDAHDNAQLASSSRLQITVTDVPPTVSFTMDKSNAPTHQLITVTITAGDVGGSVSSIDVFWGDSNHDSFSTSLTFPLTDSHSYSTAGIFSVEVDAHDNAGLTSTTTSHVTITDTPPVVSFTVDRSTAATGQLVTMTITSSDVGGSVQNIDVFWGDAFHDSFPTPLAIITATHKYSNAGILTIEVDAHDDAGLASDKRATEIITDIPPTLSFTEDKTSGPVGTMVTLTITSSDTDGSVSRIDLFWGDATPLVTFTSPTTSFTNTHTYNVAGTFTVEVDAFDSAGLVSSVLATKSIGGATILDPKVNFNEDKTAAAVASLVTLTISSSESGGTISGVEVRWGDGTLDTLPGTTTTDSHAYTTVGIFTVSVTATDSAVPAVTADASTELIITDVPPSVSFTTDKSSTTTGSPITVTVTSSDLDGTVATLTVFWGDGNLSPLTLGPTATASHSYTTAGIFTLSVDAEDNGLTIATAVTNVIITDIPPTVSFTSDKTAATVGSLITLTIASADTGGTVTNLIVFWGDGNTSPVTTPGPTTTLSHSYTFAGSFHVDVAVDDDAGMNADTSIPVTITDVPPSISFTADKTTATTGAPITLTITSADSDGTVSSISVFWGDGSIIETFTSPVSPLTATHTYTIQGFHTVTTQVTDNSGLQADVGTILTITDVPPIVSFTSNKSTTTTGQPISITIALSDPDGTVSTLLIIWGDGTPIDSTGNPSATVTRGHSYTNSGTYTITTHVQDNAGLTASASTEVIITDRPPTISFTEDKTTTTKGQSITLTITSADSDGTISSILLTWGDGTPPETITSLGATVTRSHTYTIAGSFTVTVVATDNTGQQGDASSTKTITDIPPIVSFTEDKTTANTGQLITLTISSSDADGTVQTLTIDWGDTTTPTVINTQAASTTGSHSYTSAGSFNVIVTAKDDAGLTATSGATKTISAVDEPPIAHFTESTTTALTGVSISFDGSTSNDPDGTIAAYAWDFGDGGTGTGAAPSHSYTIAGSYTVTLTVTDSAGLTNSVTALKTITDRSPVAKFTESATSANTGQAITFDASTSSDPDGTITSYHWDFGDSSAPVTSTTPTTSHTYTNPSPTGGYVVTLTVTDNSGNTAQATGIKTITSPSNQPPIVHFTEDKTTANTGETITLTISATDVDDTVASIMVDWGDGTVHTLSGTGTTDIHAYISAGNAKSKTFTVSVSATDSRGAISTVVQATKTVNDRLPIVSFTEDHTTVTTGQSIILSITSNDPDGTITQTVVDWGDGTAHTLTGAATGDTHSYSSTGNSKTASHTVSVTVTDNGGNTATMSAVKTVNDLPPVAKFTESATTATTGAPISFNASASSDPDGTITSYSWNFGDGNTANVAAPINSYANPGTYTVTLTVTDNSGSTATTTATKTISPFHITAAFTESRTNAPTLTSISFDATGSSSSAGTITSYTWNFGDTMTASGPTTSHSYMKAGTYTVTLMVRDSAEHTATASAIKTITDQAPTVSFTEDETTAIRGEKITLTITSGDVDGTVTSLKVDWGDMTVNTLLGTATTDSHSYAALGTYTVKVTATDNSGMTASATATKTIVNVPPTVSFTEDRTTGPTGTMITLTITAGDTDGTVSSITVNWGDNTPVDHLAGSATSDSHSYAKAGTYTVTVTATDNDGGTKSMTATKMITDRPPVAMFTESATTSQTSSMINFDATTSNDPDGTIASYSWNFGDGTPTGTGQRIDHTYTSPGTYTVTLTVTDDNGSTNKATAVKTITQPQAQQVILVFRAFDCDDYEHGIGQLDVLINDHLIVNVPAGLFHLNGTGDYLPFQEKWVQLGPFNIGSQVTTGLNTIVFRNPLDSHECKVKNILITSGTTTLLNVTKTFEIEDESVKLTFSNPPLVLTSFTATPSTVNENMSVKFEANFTGGTGPYTCTFVFGDSHIETVTTTSHTCSVMHTYKGSGSFSVTVKVQGAATSDRAMGRVHVHVQDQGEAKSHHGEDTVDDCRSRDHEHDEHSEHRED